MAVRETLLFLVAMLPFLGLAAAVLYAGYASYQTGQLKAQRAAMPPAPDPIVELSKTNEEIIEALARARVTLDDTRATLQRGLRG